MQDTEFILPFRPAPHTIKSLTNGPAWQVAVATISCHAAAGPPLPAVWGQRMSGGFAQTPCEACPGECHSWILLFQLTTQKTSDCMLKLIERGGKKSRKGSFDGRDILLVNLRASGEAFWHVCPQVAPSSAASES